jgi:hypothetical protein
MLEPKAKEDDVSVTMPIEQCKSKTDDTSITNEVPPLEALRAARRRLLGEYGACAANSPELVLELALRATNAQNGLQKPVLD